MRSARTVEVPPYLAALVDLPLDGGHGVAALLADHLPSQPTGGVAYTVPDLPVFLQFSLAFEPDVGIHDTGMGQEHQLHIRPIGRIRVVLGMAVELRSVFPSE